jgi:DNA-binding MarR family transcriptional regulator
MESSLNANDTKAKAMEAAPWAPLDAGRTTRDASYLQLASLRRSLRLFNNFSERISRGSGLSALEYQALLAIRTLSPPGATRNMLCRELDLKLKMAEELTRRLEQNRLIRIEADATDRRFKRLLLTRRGEAVLWHLAERHLREIRRHVTAIVRILTALSPVDESCRDSISTLQIT